MLKGEPPLGFKPVRLHITDMRGRIGKASRANYSKLFSVDSGVYILDHVVEADMNIVQQAVDKCWANKDRSLRVEQAQGRGYF